MPDPVITGVFTLSGVVVTAVVTSVVFLIKRGWDVADAASTRDHDKTLNSSSLQAEERARRHENQLAAASEFLAQSHSVYTKLVAARRVRRGDGDDEKYRRGLGEVNGLEGQIAKERFPFSSKLPLLNGQRTYGHICAAVMSRKELASTVACG